MKTNGLRLLTGLLLVAFFAACSRPVAYFQKSPRASYATATPVASSDANAVAATPVAEVTPDASAAQASAALDQVDALVRNDAALSTNKTVQKRLNRVRAMLTASARTMTTAPAAPASAKTTLMQRMLLKKMDRKINRQLAPKNPEKAMANTGVLAAGAVVVIVGLILLLATSASGVGVIVLLAGAVILLVGLL